MRQTRKKDLCNKIKKLTGILGIFCRMTVTVKKGFSCGELE